MKCSTIAPAIVATGLALAGCVATKYEMARKDSPPPVLLNLAAAQPPVELGLRTTIVYNGPGSWKLEALWDEYVVTVHNQGEQPVTIAGATLIDFAGTARAPGDDPWALEKESQTLEQRYRRTGVAFARSAMPRVLITGASVATGASGGLIAGGVATAAVVSVVALPVYYLVVLNVNHANKAAVMGEFARRRLVLPIALAASDTRTGSLFFPMAPNPQSLRLQWSSGSISGEVEITLEALHGLHTTPGVAEAAPTPP